MDRFDDTIRRVLTTYANERPSLISSIDVWALGGALSRVEENATAISNRHAPYMIGIEANWSDRSDSDANIAWARQLYTKLKEVSAGGDYLNFPGFFENQEEMLNGAYRSNMKRLKAVKRTYDPENLFAGALNIKPE